MNVPLVIGALIVSIVIVLALINVVKTTVKTALIIALIVFGLQVAFGVGPQDLWKQVQKTPQAIFNWLRKWGNKYKPPTDYRDGGKESNESRLWYDQPISSPFPQTSSVITIKITL